MIFLFGIILLRHADQFTIFESIGLIHLDWLHPISGLLPWKRRLSSGLTSLRTCFKPEIVVYKFIFGGPWRVFCQLHIFAYPRRVILHKGFVDARLQRPRGSKFGRATGLIHLDQLHPISGLLPWKQRLNSGLTSLRTCFKPEIVVYKFLFGWVQESILSAWACFKPEIVVYKFLFGWALESILSAWYFCLFKTSNPA